MKQAPLPAGFAPASNDPPSGLARTSAIFHAEPVCVGSWIKPRRKTEPRRTQLSYDSVATVSDVDLAGTMLGGVGDELVYDQADRLD